MNLSAQFKEYLLSQSSPASKATVKNYLSDVNRFIAWFEAKFNKQFSPDDVSYEVINSFKEESLASYSPASVDRNISTLRKFFSFLKLDSKISHSPFEANNFKVRENQVDPWKIRDFKNYLYVLNASNLTIKNYIIDVKQFKSWVESTIPDASLNTEEEILILKNIDSRLINDYKLRLLNELHLSPVSVNRKLSSLRRYCAWAKVEGIIKPEIEVLNETRPNPIFAPTTLPVDEQQKTIPQAYSKFPPIRVIQKSKVGMGVMLEAAIIAPLAFAMNQVDHALWVAKGKPVFEGDKIKSPLDSILEPLETPKGPVKNVPKSFYAPTRISVAGFPTHMKVWHFARYKRPNWYIKYHSYPLTSYLHFSLLLLAILGFGFLISQNMNTKKERTGAVLAGLPSTPARNLSFQGRLTDAKGTAINKGTNLRMAIYNTETSSGSALLWQEVVNATPDSDGIFNVILGKSTPIPSTLFAQNSALWLGVTVENTEELAPRQPIATVAFASNSETLQGLPPITGTSSTANVVLALNSSGNLTIGGSRSPVFQATGGTFTLSGRTLMLTTTTASNGNVVIAPNGNGIVDIQKVIKNTSNNGAVIQGSIQVDDIFLVTAGTPSQAALNVGQSSTGDLIVASTSGVTRFRVDNGGNITAGGSVNGLSLSGGTINSGTWKGSSIETAYGGTGLNTSSSTGVPYISGGVWSVDSNSLAVNHGGTGMTSYTNGDLIYANSSSGFARLGIGGNGNCLISNGSAPTWSSCGSVSSDGNFGQAFGALFPNNSTEDFLIGGQSTDSAKFAILNVNGVRGTQTASISGGLVLDSDSANIKTTNFQTLTFGGSTTGLIQVNNNSGLSFVTFDTKNSMLGLGTTTPAYMFDVAGNINSSATVSAQDVKTAYPFADVRSFGALGNGSTDDTTAIQNAINSPGEAMLNPSKTYKITSTIVIGDGKTLFIPKGTTLLFDSPSASIAAVEVQDGGKLYGSGKIESNRSSWDNQNPQFGVLLSGSQGIAEIGTIENFEWGVYLRGANQGSAYNNVKVGTLLNSIQGVKLDATGTGWVNQNYIHIDRLTIWSDYETNDPANWANSYGIYIDSHSSYSPNANRFSGSIEGVKTGMRLAGDYNRLDGLRFELNTGSDILVKIENTSNGDAPSYNWWFGEYANVDWNTQIGGAAKTQRALIAYGVRGLSEYNEDGLVFGPYYRNPKLSYDTPSDEIRLDRDSTRVFTYNAAGYFNIPNSNVGIGISSVPNAALQVAGSASISGSLALYSTPTLQSTNFQTLTIGGNTTGNIVLSPKNGSGTVQLTNFTTNGGLIYTNGSGVLAQTGAGSLGECLISNGGGAPSFGSCSGSGTSNWNIVNGVISPKLASTLDLIIGGSSTAAAKFAFTNVNSGTPTLRLYDSSSTNYLSLYHNGTNAYITPSSGELVLGAGSGNVVIEDALVNDTANNSGAVRVSDKFHVVGTENSLALGLFNNTGSGDLFTASASGTTRFVIQNNGDVGIGNANPGTALHVGPGSTGNIWDGNGSNQTPQIYNTTTSGFSAIATGVMDGTRNRRAGLFVNDTSGVWGLSSTYSSGSMPFVILADTNQERLRIDDSGRFGIGTTSPRATFDLRGGANTTNGGTIPVASISGSTSFATLHVDQSGTGDIFTASNSGNTRFTITNSGAVFANNLTNTNQANTVCYNTATKEVTYNSGSGCTSSSAKFKKEIAPLNDSLALLMRLSPVSFKYNEDYQPGGKTRVGFIAEEVNQIDPRLVDFASDGITPNGVQYANITALLTQAVQEQQLQLNNMQTSLNSLETDQIITGSGDLSLVPTVDYNFEVRRHGTNVDKIGAFSEIFVARLKGGYFELGRLTVTTADITFAKIGELTVNTARIASAQIGEISTDSLAVATENITIAGENIRDYIYSIVDERVNQKQIAITSPILETDIIKPSSGNNLTVKLPTNDASSKFEIVDASGSAVATIDAQGNASFSGVLASSDIQTNSASISGNLAAGTITANELNLSADGLARLQSSISSSSSIVNNYYYNSSSAESSPSGILANSESLLGGTNFFDVSVANRLFIGAQLSLAQHSINVLGSNLEIQPLNQGGVSFQGGKIVIDTDGNLKVGGNAYFAKNVDIGGKLSTGIIAPISGRDLVFQFEDTPKENSNVEFKTGSNSAVLSFSNKGDVKASGSGTFNKLNLSFVPKAIAVNDTEIIATGSAGTAEIKPYKNELTIKNPLVTKDSLIYITPKTGTPNQSVYLLRQVPENPVLSGIEGSFTVGLPKAISKSVPFNWILIN